MKTEGVIKFNSHWTKKGPLPTEWIHELNSWRRKLFELGLVGVTPDGIGYGNLSCRFGSRSFIITGSGTGKLKRLSGKHFTMVTHYNFESNMLKCEGPVIASSESLSHAAIYDSDPTVGAVFHVHHLSLWEKLMNSLPSTRTDIPYGTVGMAKEIERLYLDPQCRSSGIFAMGGHPEGILSFGTNPDVPGKILMDWLGIN